MDPRLIDLDHALLEHAKNKDFAHAQKVVNAILGLFKLQGGTHDWDKPFTDNGGKLRANAGWFMNAPGYADRRATYILANKNTHNIDFKAFWLKKTNKSVISWLVALTPNFEDRPYYKKENLGIDFIIPEAADKVLVVLSNNFTLRTLELSEKLSKTDLEIFSKWIQPLDFANKEQVHTVLWESFDFEPVNRIFYKKISELFVDLKQHLVNNNLFDDKHASYFANRLIGRVIFCWFLDKKEIINPKMGYFNTNNQDSTTYYHTKLEQLFFHTLNTPISLRDEQASQPQPDMFPDDKPKNLFNYTADLITPFLNGGLFEPRDNDLAGDYNLTFPADYFDRLYEHLHHYHFTTDESTSDYQQVAIDPEMLGRIFENLLAEQSEDTGEQARKAKGAFYTPREIVDYMCRESLRQYLKSQLPQSSDLDQRLSELLDIKTHEYRDQQRNYQANLKPYKEDLMKALDNLKVLDPACGSGAFPMGMQQLLLSVYERLDTRLDSYRTKIGILKNNIYGVDIEPMAVEISRLRAWLSIIVDQDPHTKIEALPNLDFKFVCANSLLPLAPNGQMTFGDHADLEKKQQSIREGFFTTTDHDQKETSKQDYRNLLNTYTHGFQESDRIRQLKTYDPFDSENVTAFFDPDFMFGFPLFDIVIGNPPYVQLQKFKDNPVQEVYKNAKYLVYDANGDLYCLFYERGLELTKEGTGLLCYITSNKWMRAGYGAKLRQYFANNNPSILIDCGPGIFASATVDTNILLIANSITTDNKLKALSLEKSDIADLYTAVKDRSTTLDDISSEPWLISSPNEQALKKKIESLGKPLKYWDVKINYGIKTGLNEAFIINQAVRDQLVSQDANNADIIKPILRGRDIQKYTYTFSNMYVILVKYGSYKTLSNSYPFVYNHLLKYETNLKDRGQCRYSRSPKTTAKGYPGQHHWLELDNNPTDTYLELFEKEKIVWAETMRIHRSGDPHFPRFGYTEKNSYYTDKTAFIMTGIDLLYILGIVNSSFGWYLARNYADKLDKGGYMMQKAYIENYPIPIISDKNNRIANRIVELIKQIIANNNADFEKEIDLLVYKLYDLTPEEIAIVNNAKE